jgi:glycosyltransferase involved in cell wall biosynthesis
VKERIKILYVIGTLRVGGAERHLVALLKRIDQKVFAPEVCCIRKQGEFVEEVEAAGIPILDLGIERYYSFRAFRRFLFLIRYMRKKRFRIVHTFLFHTNFFGGLAAWLARIPRLVISIRNMNIHFRAKHVCTVRLMGRLADRVTVVSEQVRQMVLRREKLQASKIVCIPNGIDMARLAASTDREAKKKALGIEQRRPVLGCVANLASRKGHCYLVEAMAQVAAAYPDAALLLIGGGVQKQKLTDRVASLNLDGHVRFLNRRRDVPEILDVIDLFVLPSLEEGMSNALLEAAAKGRPAVVTDVGGNAEVVVHGETGLVVPPRDAEAMARAILDLLRDADAAAAMGARGRDRVRRKFSIEQVVDNVQALYRDLISERDS